MTQKVCVNGCVCTCTYTYIVTIKTKNRKSIIQGHRRGTGRVEGSQGFKNDIRPVSTHVR